MNGIKKYALGLFLVVATQASAQTTAATTASFCPQPVNDGDAKYCFEISAGQAFVGEGRECLKANGPASLAALYKVIGEADLTGAADTPETALAILNANRKGAGQAAVSANNFGANGILFVAISTANDEKYHLQTSAEGSARINLNLTANLIPTAAKSRVDRRPAVIKQQTPFYRVIALSKALLDEYKIASWNKTELFLTLPNGAADVECSFP